MRRFAVAFHVSILAFLILIGGCSGCERSTQPSAIDKTNIDQASPSRSTPTSEETTNSEQVGSPTVKASKSSSSEVTSPSYDNELTKRDEDGITSLGKAERSGRKPVLSSSKGSQSRPGQMAKSSPALSPAEALSQARKKQGEAKDLAAGGKYAEAYSRMLEAWELVDAQADDARCRQLKDEVGEQMESYAERANARYRGKNRGDLSGKALIEN